MADYRRHFDVSGRRPDRDWPDARDDRHSWFDDRHGRYDADRPSDRDERGSQWESAADDRMPGTYRTDDRGYHDRYRESGDRYRESGDRYRDGERYREGGDRYGDDAARSYYRAAREQRDDYLRWSAQNMGVWGDQSHGGDGERMPPSLRDRGHWRQYETHRGDYAGRGPKGYQRSDERILEEMCDRMTDDPFLDASDIEVDVKQGEVTLAGSVVSRDQKRRAEDIAERIGGVRDVTNRLRITRDAGHNWTPDSTRVSGPGTTSSQPVSEASGKGTPSKSPTGSTA